MLKLRGLIIGISIVCCIGLYAFFRIYTGSTTADPEAWLRYVVTKRNPSLCSNTPIYSAGNDVGNYSKETSIKICMARYGGLMLDADYCTKLNRSSAFGGASDYMMCFKEYIHTAKAPEDCEKVPTSIFENNFSYEMRDPCYQALAKKLRDSSICNKIQSGELSIKKCIEGID